MIQSGFDLRVPVAQGATDLVTRLSRLGEALSSRTYRYQCETEIQAQIAILLEDSGFSFTREARLTAKDRVDFLVGDIAIEVKIGGTLAQITRQAHRYLGNEAVAALVLVTDKAKHRGLPRTMRGKPARVLYIPRLP